MSKRKKSKEKKDIWPIISKPQVSSVSTIIPKWLWGILSHIIQGLCGGNCVTVCLRLRALVKATWMALQQVDCQSSSTVCAVMNCLNIWTFVRIKYYFINGITLLHFFGVLGNWNVKCHKIRITFLIKYSSRSELIKAVLSTSKAAAN